MLWIMVGILVISILYIAFEYDQIKTLNEIYCDLVNSLVNIDNRETNTINGLTGSDLPLLTNITCD
jgi:hypothetical protein